MEAMDFVEKRSSYLEKASYSIEKKRFVVQNGAGQPLLWNFKGDPKNASSSVPFPGPQNPEGFQGNEFIQMVLERLQMELQKARQRSYWDRIEGWKAKLGKDDKNCYNWLKNMRVVPNVQIGKAQNAVQSFEILHDYWSKIWFRDTDHQAAIEASVPYLPPDAQTLEYFPLSADLVAATAGKLRWKADGMDQWEGSEIYTLIEMSGFIPKSWCWRKQAHVPKTSGRTQPADYHPITFFVVSIDYGFLLG